MAAQYSAETAGSSHYLLAPMEVNAVQVMPYLVLLSVPSLVVNAVQVMPYLVRLSVPSLVVNAVQVMPYLVPMSVQSLAVMKLVVPDGLPG